MNAPNGRPVPFRILSPSLQSMNAAPTSARLPFPYWLARLSDYLPQGFIDGRSRELAALYDDGCTVSLAATYCRAYLLAPRLEGMDA